MNDVIGSGASAHATPISGIVITKLSIAAFCVRAVVIAALLFGCWHFALYPDGATAKDIFENRVFWVAALLLTPLSAWDLWRLLRQMIFHGGRAVWIEDGRLKFIDDAGFGRRFQSIEISDIRELSVDRVQDFGSPWGFPCVAVKVKNGWVRAYIMTLFFTDSAPVVYDRLAKALSLPKSDIP